MNADERTNFEAMAHPHMIVKPATTGIRFSMRFLQDRLGMTDDDHVLITFNPEERSATVRAFNPFKEQLANPVNDANLHNGSMTGTEEE